MRAFQSGAIPRPRIDEQALQKFLESAGPVDLEIGCGAGWHPIQYATQHPDRRLVAIERTQDKFNAFAQRLQNHPSLTNVFGLHADATGVLVHVLPEHRFERIFLLYPNPEPKNPAQRWIRRPFFSQILKVAKPGAHLTFATNEDFYFDELLEWGPREWGLKIFSQRSFQTADQPHPRTHFEKKYLARGETCFDVVFEVP